MPKIEQLELEISAQANTAVRSIDTLINKLKDLTNALNFDTSSFEKLSQIANITKSTQQVENLKKNLESINNIKVSPVQIKINGMDNTRKSLEEYTKLLQNFRKDMDALGKPFGSMTNLPVGMLEQPIQNLKQYLEEVKSAYPKATETISQYERELQRLQTISSQLKAPAVQPQLDTPKMTQSIDAVQERIQSLKDKFKDIGKDFHFDGNMKELEKQLSSLDQQYEKLYKRMQTKIDLGQINTSSFEKIIRDMQMINNQITILNQSRPSALNRTIEENSQKVKQLRESLLQLKIPDIRSNSLEQLQKQLDRTLQKMSTLKAEMQNKLATGKITANVDDSGYVRLREQIALTGKTITAIQDKMRTLGSETKATADSMNKNFIQKLSQLKIPPINSNSLKALQKELEKVERQTETLKAKLANGITIGRITPNVSDTSFRNLQEHIALSEKKAEQLRNKISELEQESKKTSGFDKLKNAINQVFQGFSKYFNLTNLAKGATDKLSQSSQKLSQSMNGVKSSMNKAVNGMKNFVKQALAAMGIYVSVYGAIKGLQTAFKSASGYLETYNYFEAAFNQVGDSAKRNWQQMGYESAEAYAESFSKRARELTAKMTGFSVSDEGLLTETRMPSLGLDPNLLMNYQATFGQMASSMGVASETALKLSTVLTEIGADLASVKNLDMKSVWNDMSSGLVGMSRSWDKYGVNIRNANLQQKLNELGIKANISALLQSDKAMLRTIILLENTKFAWGDMADTIDNSNVLLLVA